MRNSSIVIPIATNLLVFAIAAACGFATEPNLLPLPPTAQTLSTDPNAVLLASYNQPAGSRSRLQSYWPFGQLQTRRFGKCDVLEYGLVGRGFYLNDQRIRWSGLEATFAAEGALFAGYRRHTGAWTTLAEGELFFNQPSDANIYLNSVERASYAANYDFDPVEFSRLNVGVRRGDWEVRLGKMWTPFGRYYTQLWTNQLLYAPFIRTESINWRETGLLVHWDPGMWVIDAGVFNGHLERDSNSSKALVARVGAEQETWAVGASVKWHDGSGSEDQKTFKNHAGVDAMVRHNNWRLSGEAIYDEYGLKRDTFDPNDIFWEKSIYYRDLNNADDVPITGFGYYLTLDYLGELWSASFTFGQFFPEYIGNVQHDRTQNRGIAKLTRSFGPHLQGYTVLMFENEGYIGQGGQIRRGEFVLTGLQCSF